MRHTQAQINAMERNDISQQIDRCNARLRNATVEGCTYGAETERRELLRLHRILRKLEGV